MKMGNDPIGKIKLLVYCGKIEDQFPGGEIKPRATHPDNPWWYDQEEMDLCNLAEGDSFFSCISQTELVRIENLYLLHRIALSSEELYQQLSDRQKKYLVRYESQNRWISEDDVPSLLDKVQDCNKVERLYIPDDTTNLAEEYSLRDEDLLEIAKGLSFEQLNVEQCQFDYDRHIEGNQVLTFYLPKVRLLSGVELSQVTVKLKLDNTDMDGKSYLYISLL